MAIDEAAKDAVFRALKRAGLKIDRQTVEGMMGLIGSDFLPFAATASDLVRLSSLLRDMAGDIDDGLVPGRAAKHPTEFVWVPAEIGPDDRLVDWPDAVDAVVQAGMVPPRPPGCVLVRRWKRTVS